MNFTKESGAIIGSQGQLLGLTDGEPSNVDFSIEQLLKLHKLSPGCIHRLTHTHPIGMPEASSRDINFIKAMAFSFYPFPFRLGVINPGSWGLEGGAHALTENIYTGMLQPRDLWKLKGGEREVEIFIEEKKYHSLIGGTWTMILAERSYDYIKQA